MVNFMTAVGGKRLLPPNETNYLIWGTLFDYVILIIHCLLVTMNMVMFLYFPS